MTDGTTGNPAGLILASSSPQRQSLLKEAGFEFAVEPADIDEKAQGGHFSPVELAERIAFAKAQAVSTRFGNYVVLAADARAMLQLLAGTTQVVITAVCLVRQSTGLTRVERVLSAVRMAPLTALEIDNYVATGQWKGKAGAYGIQDPDPFIERVRGCRTNVIGLPMKTTVRLLESAGIYPVKK
ncbi:MAG: Maf family protein [Tepidisphaeraceae bacterium]|jgi:septum formation protein